LRRILGAHVEVQARQHQGTTTSLYFYTMPLVQAEIRNESRPVLLLESEHRWLHIAIDLHFIARQLWRVNHVSIGLLEGDPSATQKEQLLRAEWQVHAKPDDSGHAQPHWHVLRAAGSADLPNFSQVVEQESGFRAFLGQMVADEPGSHDAFGHFHYAMMADWTGASPQGVRHVPCDELAVVKWIDGCVRYIRHQLAHVDRRAGGQVHRN